MVELISIIIPIYKTEKYLEKCLTSVVNQTYKNLEILLIDDDSPDDSLKICKQWAKKDKRIKVYHKCNEGVSETRNYGIKEAKGKYICFIDSDDYIECTMIEKLYRKIKDDDADICSCNFYIVRDNTKVLNKRKFEKDILSDIFKGNGFVCNKIYKKSIIQKTKFDKHINIYEDLLFNISIVYNNPVKYSYINEPLYYYEQRNDSAMNSTDFKRNIYSFEALEKIISLLKTMNNNYYINYECNYIGNILKLNKERKQLEQLKKYINIAKNYSKYDLNWKNLNFKNKIKLILFKLNFTIRNDNK